MINSSTKKVLHDFIPPIILNAYRSSKIDHSYGFFGQYSSWEAARNETDGYDSNLILEKVKESLLKVKEGKAVYERDSVIFDHIQYSFPLLAALLRVAVENQGNLSVLDFGGSLGSSYFQCRDFLSIINYLKWSIVEQDKFVRCGKRFFENESLQFFDTIETCIKHTAPNVILLSSVVQYLENPYLFLKNLLDYNFQYIIFDRTTFVSEGSDRITIQKVPPEIYSASYPAWFFNLEQFLQVFQDRYELIAQFDALGGLPEIRDPYAIARDLGFIFRIKNSFIS
jgi:putative methyltransferase (TIGR04325 family)